MKFLSQKSTFPSKSAKVERKVSSVELTFMKKWRESKCTEIINNNEKWLYRTLQVRDALVK